MTRLRVRMFNQSAALFCLLAATASSESFDWPSKTGPYGCMASQESGKYLRPDINKAVKVWESGFIATGKVGDYNSNPEAAGGYCTPILWNDRIYVYYFSKLSSSGGEPVKPGIYNGDDNLRCLDAKTGKTLWTRKYIGRAITIYGEKAGPGLSATVSGGKVYFMGSGAYIYCVDGITGTTVWERKIGRLSVLYEKIWAAGKDVGFNRVMMTHPAVAGNVVAFSNCVHFKYQYGSGADRYNYGEHNGMVAFDAGNGDSLWEVKACLGSTGEGAAGKGNAPVSWNFGGKDFFIAGGETDLVCVDPATGGIVWTIAKGRQKHLSPVVRDSLLLCTGDSASALTAYRVGLQGGKEIWSLPSATYGGVPHYPCIYKDRVYILSNLQKKLLGLDAKTGAVLAQVFHSGGLNFEHDNGFVIASDERIFTCTGVPGFGILSWDAATLKPGSYGLPLSPMMTFGYVARIHPIITNGMIYVRNNEKGVICYNIEGDRSEVSSSRDIRASRPSTRTTIVMEGDEGRRGLTSAATVSGRRLAGTGTAISKVIVKKPR